MAWAKPAKAEIVAHQQKKVADKDELASSATASAFRSPTSRSPNAEFYKPPRRQPAKLQYLHERRQALGGYIPRAASNARRCRRRPIEFVQGVHRSRQPVAKSRRRWPSSASCSSLLQDKELGKWIVPIIPDEARTFGMEAFFTPVRHLFRRRPALRAGRCKTLTRYREAKNGRSSKRASPRPQSMSSFIAAGTAYANARHADDSVLHLLFDVRLPAHRRSDLGRRRHAARAASSSAAPRDAPR